MAGPSLEGIVNPVLIEWARTACRLSVADAAAKIGIKPDRLESWERGTEWPTLAQLRKMADVYRRAVSFFFLNQKPRDAKPPTDYRRLELSADATMSPALANAIRSAEVKREAVLDILRDTESEAPTFDLSVRQGADSETVAAEFLQALAITRDIRESWQDEYAALRAWKAAVERMGVLVMQLSSIPLDELRGCALAITPLPVILLNSNDTPLGRVFTLLHELTHLAGRESSLCDLNETAPHSRASDQVEQYCNHVAGAMLVPQVEVEALKSVASASANTVWHLEELDGMRRHFWASREVVLRRLLILGKTSQANYQRARREFLAQYAAMRRTKSKGFVPPFRRILLSNGRLLTEIVLDAYEAQAITGSELSRILGAKLDHLPKITADIRGPAST